MRVKKFIIKEGTYTHILNPEWIKINYPDTYRFIHSKGYDEAIKDNFR